MKKITLFAILLSLFIISCKKEDASRAPAMNTWTFKAQGTTYSGQLYWDPLLNTLLQGNDSYTFTMLGGEENSDRVFNIVLSLLDTTFTATQYQSGLSGNDYINAFYFSHGLAGADIYKSSNYSPGPVLNYTIESYNAGTRVLEMTFSGNAEDPNGIIVPITDGRVTCKVEKM